MKHRLVFIFVAIFSLVFLADQGPFFLVHAQDMGIAQRIAVTDTNIAEGSIITYRGNQYSLSVEPYDKGIFGVVTKSPAIELYDDTTKDTVAVLINGTVSVRVNSQNGPIKKGDLITSSQTAGVGMKATKSGFILGVAESDYDSTDTSATDVIPVTLSIKFSYGSDSPSSSTITGKLVDVINGTQDSTFGEKARLYTAAGILLISFIFAGLTVLRTTKSAVEVTGRNPLAIRGVMIGLVVQIIFSLFIFGAGIGIAYIVFKL